MLAPILVFPLVRIAALIEVLMFAMGLVLPLHV